MIVAKKWSRAEAIRKRIGQPINVLCWYALAGVVAAFGVWGIAIPMLVARVVVAEVLLYLAERAMLEAAEIEEAREGR